MPEKPNSIFQAGDYKLQACEIISYRVSNEGEPFRMDIKPILASIQLEENIFHNSIIGKIQVLDAQDVRSILPITGLERLQLKFSTPGLPGTSAVANDGHPFYIYAIDMVKQDMESPRMQVYDILFCSKESYYNDMRKVSKAYTGRLEDAVEDIFTNRKYLNSTKQLFIEPTRTNTKIVIPNKKPMDAIRMIANSCVSGLYQNSGYLFFENSVGYHFRSYESLLAVGGATARPSKWKYQPQIQNIRADEKPGQLGGKTPAPGTKDVIKDLHSIHSWSFEKPVDMLQNFKAGAYANRFIEYDPFFKLITTNDYDYNEDFYNHFHTEHSDGYKTAVKQPLPYAKFDDTDRPVSKEPLQKVVLKSNTSKVHDSQEFPSHYQTTQKRISQHQFMRKNILSIIAPGNSLINAGDIITFDMPLFRPIGDNLPIKSNPHYAGRYLVIAVEHTIAIAAGKYEILIKAVKDSVRKPFQAETDSFPIASPPYKGHNIYDEDKKLLNVLAKRNKTGPGLGDR
jgi:hypothetical protein